MVDLVAIHLSPSTSLQRASLFLALSGSLAESGEPLCTRRWFGCHGIRWIIRWIIRCTSPRFEHCKENRADRATSEVHQDGLRVSSLSKQTFANHIEPYWTILNHVHSVHSGFSLELFDLVETCWNVSVLWDSPLYPIGSGQSLVRGKEAKCFSGVGVWVVSMLGSVRTVGASRLLGAVGLTATYNNLWNGDLKIRPRILLVDSVVHCACPNVNLSKQNAHWKQHETTKNIDIKWTRHEQYEQWRSFPGSLATTDNFKITGLGWGKCMAGLRAEGEPPKCKPNMRWRGNMGNTWEHLNGHQTKDNQRMKQNRTRERQKTLIVNFQQRSVLE
jgi:hypothetical protein